MSLNVRPKRQVTRKSLNEEDLFESINHAIGDDYPKLVISDDYKPMQRVNGRPEYFTEPQIINNEPCIIVKWVGDQECMEKLQTLVNLKEKYLYDLIPWILSNIKPNECESDSIIKEYIDTIWRCTKTVSFHTFFFCFCLYLKIVYVLPCLSDYRIEFPDWDVCRTNKRH